MLRLKFLVLLPAKQLLDQKVIHHHAQEAARRQHRISLAKRLLADAFTDMLRQRVKVIRDKSVEEARREFMVLKRREPEQPGQFAVTRRALQKLTRHSLKHLRV